MYSLQPTLTQIFDIMPIRSFLRPGESEEVEFVYYGHANRKALGKCTCDVTGGPAYTVDLVGEASNVGFRCETHAIQNQHDKKKFKYLLSKETYRATRFETNRNNVELQPRTMERRENFEMQALLSKSNFWARLSK